MSEFIAALQMYDWPEARTETDAEWAGIRDRLRAAGVPAPDALTRDIDMHEVWLRPNLLFAQTCWGPLELGLAKHVTVLGQPDYSPFEGGDGPLYSSAIVMRKGTSPSPLRGGSRSEAERGGGEFNSPSVQVAPPPPGLSGHPPRKGEGKAATIPLDHMRGKRFAYNSTDSMSGIIALTRDLAAVGETLDIFSERIESGGHRLSIIAVAEGRADVCAVDCRSWALAQRFEPAANEVEPVGWTAKRKGLPYIAAPGVAERFPALKTVIASG